MASALRHFLIGLAALLMIGVGWPRPVLAESAPARIGSVLMHGKGGTPSRLVSELASGLEGHGVLVANLEMLWSGRCEYDVDVGAAEREVEAALNTLRQQEAQKLFVAGHSQGGVFALYFGGRHVIDGVIAIAPGGNVGSQLFRDKLGENVALARQLVTEDKGDEKTRLADYEGAKGTYPVITTPALYLSWFDPAGAMNQTLAVQNMNPKVPVLFVAPTDDYPGLLKVKQQMFEALPGNPQTRLDEPNANHLGAPSVSLTTIVEWTTGLVKAP